VGLIVVDGEGERTSVSERGDCFSSGGTAILVEGMENRDSFGRKRYIKRGGRNRVGDTEISDEIE